MSLRDVIEAVPGVEAVQERGDLGVVGGTEGVAAGRGRRGLRLLRVDDPGPAVLAKSCRRAWLQKPPPEERDEAVPVKC